MSCDQSRISNIESLLKSNPNSISTNDLIYYLKCNSNNSILDPDNLDNTANYLNKINISFAYENIFVNTSNYGTIVTSIIGLLIPFYYFFPRFYKIGFIGTLIGVMSFFNLYSKTNNLYSPFFSSIGIVFISLTLAIYIIFFILLNKLNHYSLFFISAIISFLIINYILRFILTIPTEVNKWNQYNASMNNNSSSSYTEYNTLLETACFQVMDRFKMKLPSGNMLYSYLTVFEIGENPKKNRIIDFLTNMFAPFISIFILWFLGFFLSQLKDETIETTKEKINLFPLIGIHDDSKKYYTCQANYILPKELNVGLLIHNHLDKYNFDDTLYLKVEKALTRISKELLQKYNPKFFKLEDIDDNNLFKNEIIKNLKDNKVFKEILTLLKRNNLDLFKEITKEKNKNINVTQSGGVRIDNDENEEEKKEDEKRINNNNTIPVNVKRINDNNIQVNAKRINDDDYISKIKDIIEEQTIPYQRKSEMLDLVDHIKNTLKIINEVVKDYDEDWILARDELLYDKEIKEEQKTKLKEILDDYINKFKENLEIKNETLFGYHYNIIGYQLFGTNIRKKSNNVFGFILRLFSSWLLFSKPIGSPWVIAKYIMSSSYGFKKLLKNLSGSSMLWKYFAMGLDRSYFEEIYKDVVNNKENSIFNNPSLILDKSWWISLLNKFGESFLTILLFILLLMVFYFYNSTTFGLTSSPSWYNILYQIIFIIVITCNISEYNRNPPDKKLISLLTLNKYFLIAIIGIPIIIFFIIWLIAFIKGN